VEATIRKASKDEEAAIMSLYRKAAEKGRADGSSTWDDEYPNSEILAEDLRLERLYVLEEEGRLVSAITIEEGEDPEIERLPWTNRKSCFLVRLCVSPERQSRGVGEKMMRAVSECARKAGFESTHHLAATENVAANRLYGKMGYCNLGSVHLYGRDYAIYEMIL
jgi:GNAT superfamily N-acetyltransferase